VKAALGLRLGLTKTRNRSIILNRKGQI
jgi:hypothetical protein